MSSLIKIKDKTIVEQMASMRRNYAHFTTTINRNTLFSKGWLQPTSRSEVYSIQITYRMKERPIVKITNPELVKNFKGEDIPHVYPGKQLCLYRPKYHEFNFSDFISDTIIPWTSLWLYYYEVWHITGQWLGGGEHINNKS